MSGKADSFVKKGLDPLFDKLGIVSNEMFTKEGQIHIFFAFDKQYVELEDLMELQRELKSENIRIYTNQYSRFETIKHSGVIFCENVIS